MNDDFIAKALTRARCPICDWPMAETMEQGCIPGNCSYRPDDPNEQARIRQRRAAMTPPTSVQTVTARRPNTVVISDWLANCQVGQWTPFEAAVALKSTLSKEGFSVANTDYIAELEERAATLTSSLTAAEARVTALEQVISEEMYPENCDDDANRMLLESAIDSHNRRMKSRAALSQTEEGAR